MGYVFIEHYFRRTLCGLNGFIRRRPSPLQVESHEFPRSLSFTDRQATSVRLAIPATALLESARTHVWTTTVEIVASSRS